MSTPDSVSAADIPEWERGLLAKQEAEQAQVDKERLALLPWLEVTSIRLVRNGRIVHVSGQNHDWTPVTELLDELRAIVRPSVTP